MTWTARLALARAYVALMASAGGWRGPVAVALTVETGLVEGVGLLFLVPLLGLVGVDLGSGAADAVAARVAGALSSAGLPLTLPVVLAVFVAITVAQALAAMAQTLVNLRLEARISARLRSALYEALLHADWLLLARQRGSDLAHTLTTEVDRTAALTHQSLSTLATSAQIAVALAIAARIAPAATLVVSGAGLLLLLVMRSRAARSEQLGREYASASAAAYGLLTDGLAALRTIKSVGAESRSLEMVGDSHGRLVDLWYRGVANYVQGKALLDAGAAVVLALLVYGAVSWLQLPAAALLLLLFIFARTVPRASALNHSVHLFVHALPAFDRVTRLLEACRAAHEPAGADLQPPLVHAVTLEGVSFAYEPGRPALDGVWLDIPARRITALVGASGSGKTTIADLVLGLLRPDAGAVRVDGRLLTRETARAWRARVAYVSQDPFLFHDTIRANLLWARPDARPDDLADALARAGASAFVARLPDGLDTIVGDRGSRLSGGERQRLAVARALLRRPDVLVLDEPTSALDAASERHLLDVVGQLASATAVLLITHRLSSVRSADRIHVVDAGRVVESGSWAELMDEPTQFARLSRLQDVSS